jgi:uncharacterized protein with FMN-binding domain
VRRAIAATLGTVAGLVALLNYKTTAVPQRIGALGSGAGATPTSAGNGLDDGGNGRGQGTTGTTTTTNGSPTTQANDRVVKGQEVDNRFGPVQVAVTLRGNQIVDVNALQLPFDRARSQFISEQAGPMLRQETLAAQSAQIDVIGGATYTSDGYAQSLQSALDSAKP